MDKIDLVMMGKVIRNKFQVFDLTFVFLLGELGNVTVMDLEEEIGEILFEVRGICFRIRLSYSMKFAFLGLENEMVVDLDFFIREFLYKRYSVSENNRFSSLLVRENFNRLRALVWRNFEPQKVVFGMLSKDLFCYIVSFLNKEEMFEFSCVSFEIKGYFQRQTIWKGVFRFRNKNIRLEGADIDWKKSFLARKELVINKIVSNYQVTDWERLSYK
jgi:hypothetical protein